MQVEYVLDMTFTSEQKLNFQWNVLQKIRAKMYQFYEILNSSESESKMAATVSTELNSPRKIFTHFVCEFNYTIIQQILFIYKFQRNGNTCTFMYTGTVTVRRYRCCTYFLFYLSSKSKSISEFQICINHAYVNNYIGWLLLKNKNELSLYRYIDSILHSILVHFFAISTCESDLFM